MSSTRFSAPGQPGGTLVTREDLAQANPCGHGPASRHAVAERLAGLLGFSFGGEFDAAASYARPLFFVPHDCLLAPAARQLGIRCARDFFGGVVPHAFVATKVITHPRLHADAAAPPGWSDAFPAAVGDVVLRGFSAFARGDAQRAALDLLDAGEVRIKRADGIGGAGQYVAASAADVNEVLADIDEREFAQGVVVEENLKNVTTYSVGQVEVRGLVASYVGVQRLTRNNHGTEVYGGSSLDVVRGEFDRLAETDMPDAARKAVRFARQYDRAASSAYPGFFASRRNYDVAQGVDAAGRSKTGVLEQSWRIGGASSAEIMAVEALAADPACKRLRAASEEHYGDGVEVPPGAFICFRGRDEHVGALTKYARVTRDVDAQ